MSATYDVAVVGAGVVGCAVARELADSPASVALVDARHDVGDATSKANTAILHTGFDATPGTLESRLVARGYELVHSYAASTGVAVERTGAVLVAWDDDQLDALPGLHEKATKNGYTATRILTADEVYADLPALGPGALGGLAVPDESIIDPWSITLAYANDALARGVDLRLGTHITDVGTDGGLTTLFTRNGAELKARWVVNAAGMGADHLDRAFGYERFTVTPRRGQLLVFDKLARPLTPRIVLPVPTDRGKGVLVAPTIFGNVMLGPTAENQEDRRDTSTTGDGIDSLLQHGRTILPSLLSEDVTAMYAGLRAAADQSDYVVDVDPEARYLLLGGIRSTGLTSSLALAEHARDLLGKAGLDLPRRDDLPTPCRVPNLGEAFPRPHRREDLIADDPDYGRVVCFCERVTRGEIRDALSSSIPPRDLDGLRRRTRALMGRCQGFYCGAEVERLFQEGAAQ